MMLYLPGSFITVFLIYWVKILSIVLTLLLEQVTCHSPKERRNYTYRKKIWTSPHFLIGAPNNVTEP